jgi:plasmid maintenance system antidote protein VapI
MNKQVGYLIVDAIQAAGIKKCTALRHIGISKPHFDSLLSSTKPLTREIAKKIAKGLPTFDADQAVELSGCKPCNVLCNNPASKMIIDVLNSENIRQNKMAAELGIACSTLNQILSGQKRLTVRMAKRIEFSYPEFNARLAIARQNAYSKNYQE